MADVLLGWAHGGEPFKRPLAPETGGGKLGLNQPLGNRNASKSGRFAAVVGWA